MTREPLTGMLVADTEKGKEIFREIFRKYTGKNSIFGLKITHIISAQN